MLIVEDIRKPGCSEMSDIYSSWKFKYHGISQSTVDYEREPQKENESLCRPTSVGKSRFIDIECLQVTKPLTLVSSTEGPSHTYTKHTSLSTTTTNKPILWIPINKKQPVSLWQYEKWTPCWDRNDCRPWVVVFGHASRSCSDPLFLI